MNRFTFIVFLAVLCLVSTAKVSSAQVSGGKKDKTVRIISAETWDHDPSISNAQRLIGNVQLEYNKALMFCDSAYLYENEDFDAYGNIKVLGGDTLYIQGEKLHFTREENRSILRDNIILRNKEMSLSTDHLDYDIENGVGVFYEGGKITNKKNDQVLTSDKGTYFSEIDAFHFKSNVEMKNADFTVNSDTLHYYNSTEKAYFFGPTTIVGEDTDIYCENGWFDAQKNICQFNKNAQILSGTQLLKGDSIYYDTNAGFGEVFCNVEISDTTSNYLIQGDYGWYNEEKGESLITDRALLIQDFDGDSLYLHADTLKAYADSSDNNIISAYHNVRFFKEDLQGVADSMIYLEHDSILKFIKAPLLWSDENQISGDSVAIRIWDNKIRELLITENSFIISQVGDSAFNQISGRNMVGTFKEDQLSLILVKGNGRIIYYPVDEASGETTGMNKAECSDIEIHIAESEISKVVLLKRPDGVLLPNSQVKPEEKILDGFSWHPERRPMSKDDVFIEESGPKSSEP